MEDIYEAKRSDNNEYVQGEPVISRPGNKLYMLVENKYMYPIDDSTIKKIEDYGSKDIVK